MARVSQLYAELGFARAGEMAEWINHHMATEKAYTASSSVSEVMLEKIKAKLDKVPLPPKTDHLHGQQIPEDEMLTLVEGDRSRALVEGWLQRGDGAACYENKDFNHPERGHLKFASFGSSSAMLEVETPPTTLPDIGGAINWRYQLIATCRRGPACGHGACRQNYVETGERACVDGKIADAIVERVRQMHDAAPEQKIVVFAGAEQVEVLSALLKERLGAGSAWVEVVPREGPLRLGVADVIDGAGLLREYKTVGLPPEVARMLDTFIETSQAAQSTARAAREFEKKVKQHQQQARNARRNRRQRLARVMRRK